MIEGTIKIEKVVYGGFGLGRLNKKAIFVPYVIPGEEIRIRIEKEKRDFIIASPIEVIKGSPYRQSPHCPYFTICGGCHYQHIRDQYQPTIKEQTFREGLSRIANIDPHSILPLLPSPKTLFYRTRVRLKVGIKDRLYLGFYRRESREIVDINGCILAHPSINQILRHLRQILERQISAVQDIREIEISVSPQEEKGIIIFYTGVGVNRRRLVLIAQELSERLGILKDVLLKHKAYVYPYSLLGKGRTESALRFLMNGYTLLCYPGVFFQVNIEQNRYLIKKAMEFLQPSIDDQLLELFCGMGNFSMPLSKKVKRLLGVEGNPLAVKNARFNAQLNKFKNIHFINKDCLDAIDHLLSQRANFDLLLVDPPRGGCLDELKKAVFLTPKRIVYISCSPPTLARDIKFLKDCGYLIEKIQPLDMFPQTYHIEAVALLRKAR